MFVWVWGGHFGFVYDGTFVAFVIGLWRLPSVWSSVSVLFLF